jgi:hypothetical protein
VNQEPEEIVGLVKKVGQEAGEMEGKGNEGSEGDGGNEGRVWLA